MTNPGAKVTIITPAFNHELFVEQSIRSAWAQTHRDIEHIIIDDCSSDATPSIIERLVPDAPIPTRFLRNASNLGPAATINHGFEISTGSWICFLASDDAYAPHKLERLLAFAAEIGPQYGVVHGDCWTMTERGEVGGRVYSRNVTRPAHGMVFRDYALGRVGVNGLGILIRRDVLAAVGGNDPDLLAEDFDLCLRLARVTKFGYLDEGVAYIRTTQNSLGRSPARYMASTFTALEKQRSALGLDYQAALHTLHLRAFESFVRFGEIGTAASHAGQAIKTAPSPAHLFRAAELFGLALGREIALRTVGPLLSENSRAFLKSLNRELTQRVYGVASSEPSRNRDDSVPK